METHLCKHLGSVSLGPAGGAQGNKQLSFENLAALFGVPGKQGCERDGIIHLQYTILTVLSPLACTCCLLKAHRSLPPLTYKTCFMVKCKNKPQTKLTKRAHKQTKNLDKEKKQ